MLLVAYCSAARSRCPKKSQLQICHFPAQPAQIQLHLHSVFIMVKSKKKSSSIYQEQPYEEIQESDITEEPEKPQTDDFRAAMPVPNTTTGRQPLDQATRESVHPITKQFTLHN